MHASTAKSAYDAGFDVCVTCKACPLPMLLATLSPIDYGVILLYLAAMLAVGFGRTRVAP